MPIEILYMTYVIDTQFSCS